MNAPVKIFWPNKHWIYLWVGIILFILMLIPFLYVLQYYSLSKAPPDISAKTLLSNMSYDLRYHPELFPLNPILASLPFLIFAVKFLLDASHDGIKYMIFGDRIESRNVITREVHTIGFSSIISVVSRIGDIEDLLKAQKERGRKWFNWYYLGKKRNQYDFVSRYWFEISHSDKVDFIVFYQEDDWKQFKEEVERVGKIKIEEIKKFDKK